MLFQLGLNIYIYNLLLLFYYSIVMESLLSFAFV